MIMGCNAWNHSLDCSCGFGGDMGNSLPIDAASAGRLSYQNNRKWQRSANNLIDAFLSPNAECPVCGAPVFFYRSPYGGSVFFDEIGPPWPKHPCTDTSTFSSGVHTIGEPQVVLKTTWLQSGKWHPLTDIWVRARHVEFDIWRPGLVCEVTAMELPENRRIGFRCRFEGNLDLSWPTFISTPAPQPWRLVSGLWLPQNDSTDSIAPTQLACKMMTPDELRLILNSRFQHV